MKWFVLLCMACPLWVAGQKKLLSDGRYDVYFTRGGERDFSIEIKDTMYTRRLPDLPGIRAVAGRLRWFSGNYFQYDFQVQDSTTISNPLMRELYRSFGNNCIELLQAKGDTIPFRTVHTGNLHVSVSEGYYLKRPE